MITVKLSYSTYLVALVQLGSAIITHDTTSESLMMQPLPRWRRRRTPDGKHEA